MPKYLLGLALLLAGFASEASAQYVYAMPTATRTYYHSPQFNSYPSYGSSYYGSAYPQHTYFNPGYSSFGLGSGYGYNRGYTGNGFGNYPTYGGFSGFGMSFGGSYGNRGYGGSYGGRRR